MLVKAALGELTSTHERDKVKQINELKIYRFDEMHFHYLQSCRALDDKAGKRKKHFARM